MNIVKPATADELAGLLAESAAAGRSIQLGGAFTKNGMAGPIEPADVVVSTANLNSVLQYEPNDLTISVGAGMVYSDLAKLLAENRQMIPLDPPFANRATIGGIIAANCNGPRRRQYGTARDMVIGMTFATLEGKLVKSGGMVVKNVAGLDMGKLMIGSFGTLAAVTSVNFKLTPVPAESRTFVRRFASLDAAIEFRDQVLLSVLQPASIDLLNPHAAERAGLDGWSIVIHVNGNRAVIERYAGELGGPETADEEFWQRLCEFTPNFLLQYEQGAVVRVSSTLSQMREVLRAWDVPAVARAGSGVSYGYFRDAGQAAIPGGKGAIEFAPEGAKREMNLWPDPGNDFEMMKKVKHMFDPNQLLNKGRLYGRI